MEFRIDIVDAKTATSGREVDAKSRTRINHLPEVIGGKVSAAIGRLVYSLPRDTQDLFC